MRHEYQLATRVAPYLSAMKVQLQTIAGLLVACLALPSSAGAQAPKWISAGSDVEDYLRVAQLAGGVKPASSLSIRTLRDASDERLEEASTHPWKSRWAKVAAGSSWFSLLPTETRKQY